MSTRSVGTNTALLVVDVQVAVVARAHRRDETVGVIADLVERAREARVPVLWIQHHDADLPMGVDDWQIVSELSPNDDEVVVHKSYNDAFEETDLENHLDRLGVGSLVVTGAQTEWCIRSTLHGAIARGYDALLVADGHTTNDLSAAIPATSIIELTNTYWLWHAVPARSAGVAMGQDVPF